ncbi:DUF4382 domain-containing protein [uncultured Acetobacteroides sp.]|uniref:DUF4382 domain-containing protein n=1 Tax=uncultured Acetobacteroides sp. TaxID=1760811 RepID=UPI0029F5AFF3|nr:DUF4382 domain-containing protein [uncultured Acetobacteroides sp.]
MRKNLFFCLIAGAVGLGGLSSCSNEDVTSTSRFEVRLTDAPADYAKVLVDIQGVEYNVNGTDAGWKTLPLKRAGVYNLLDFRNGADTILAGEEIAAGKISQIRLKLGENNSIVLKDGKTISIKVPSGFESGLKLNLHAEFQAGVAYVLTVDFDAAKSVVAQGNGKYSLKPCLRTYEKAVRGAVAGKVTPDTLSTTVYLLKLNSVTQKNDTIAASIVKAGRFLIGGVAEGGYTVSVAPAYKFQPKDLNANVTIGNIFDLGVVAFQ